MNKFITFEGGEGAGKTTLISKIAEILEREGYKVMVTREPGGVSIAEQIRSVLVDNKNTEMDYMTEMLLYAAARREHLVHKVKKALEEDYIVLCDRFVDSSLVYQGYVRGLGIEEVWSLNEKVIKGIMPDKTIYVDILPEEGIARIDKNKDREKNRLDNETMDFHRKVREGYKTLVERFSDRIVEIDGSKDVDSVVNQALLEIKKTL